MAKSKEKLHARQLRKKGLSIKNIAQKLSVSPGSVSIWCSDIVLTKDQIKLLEKHMKDPHYGRRAIYLKSIRVDKEKRINSLYNKGIKSIANLSTRDLFIAGVALYWAEGFKKDKQIGFANSDPKMIIFFIYWLKRCFGITDDALKLRLAVNQNYINEISEIEIYWSNITNISLFNFQKPLIQKVTWKKQYENKDKYKGVLRIRVAKSLALLRQLTGMIEGLYLSLNS